MAVTQLHIPLYNGKKSTYSKTLSLTDDGSQYELIQGVMLVTPAPFEEHQTLSMKLSWLINDYLENHPIGRVHAAPRDVRLSEELVYQPDLLYISHQRQQISKPQYVDGAPDLIVEILSPSSRLRDTQDKFRDYEYYGVREYWIMEPNQLINSCFYLLSEGKYQSLLPQNNILYSQVIQGFSLDLTALEKKLK